MKNLIRLISLSTLLVFFCSCAPKIKNTIKVEDVSPWCIIDFDSSDRTPEQRMDLLKEMGFTKYGYNRGKGDLSNMKNEFDLAKENNIEISSIFLWLNAKRDSIGKLSPSNQELLNILREVDYKPTIWLSFSDNFYQDVNQEQSIELSIAMIEYVKSISDDVGCELALYNHHGWFGNPNNQIEILERLKQDAITMVYNFHHSQEYVDEFPEIVKKIGPYLSYVNLSGVKKEGPQILTIGEGDQELEMIQLLLDEGYDGPWGILGHIKTEDVQKVLKRNVDGLNMLNTKLLKEERK